MAGAAQPRQLDGEGWRGWTHRSGSWVVPTEISLRFGEWLQGEDELRGRIRAVRGVVGETELGPVVELLTVALGAGGAGTVLASSLKTWLMTRKTTAKIIVKSRSRSVTLDIQTASEVAPLLEQILGNAIPAGRPGAVWLAD